MHGKNLSWVGNAGKGIGERLRNLDRKAQRRLHVPTALKLREGIDTIHIDDLKSVSGTCNHPVAMASSCRAAIAKSRLLAAL